MITEIREKIVNFIRSRFFVPYVFLLLMCGILLGSVFRLQIVHGSEYEENFRLLSEKDIRIPGARGNIYDRNGVLLAYNELAYSVTITDTVESGNGKNEKLNGIIISMIRLIEKNGDEVFSDFGIYIDEGDNYCFAYKEAQLLRFLADIYGHAKTEELSYTERNANPDEVMEYLASSDKFGIGSYAHNEKNKSSFFPMMGYTKEEILKIAIVRYQLSLNAFQKYIATTVATDVSEKTVAVIMENKDSLDGVNIVEDTVRRYNHSVYFSQVLGYTGRISQQEYETYSAESDNYDTTDYVGKTGIEFSMEKELQGIKGSETVYVDKMGKIIESRNVTMPLAGNDIYLTIDSELQMAAYHLLEQKIAGILVGHLVDAKEVEQEGRNRSIPVYDVYSALYGNNVIDLNHMAGPYAGETERVVYASFEQKQSEVLAQLEEEMRYGDKAYQDLSKEMKEYESFVVSMLLSENYGVLLGSEIDTEDPTYLDWRVKETISIRKYLMYCIAQQWVNLSKLNLNGRYSDSEEIYSALVSYCMEHLKTNMDFSKKLYKYMLLQDRINGRQTCLILWEQDVIQVDNQRLTSLRVGAISAYSFIYDLIENLRLTPSQLGLEPCSGSVVMTDPNTGEVLALVSYPGYDNNRLANRADSAYLAKLSADKSNPLWNNATQQRTAPGSTFKMVSSVAGVQEGVINLHSIIECTGIFTKLNDRAHTCWAWPGHHGNLTLEGGIENSCNCFFYEVGYRLADDGAGYNDHVGIERLSKYAEEFGLGEKTGVEISESDPQISDRYPVDSAIGQGTHNFTTAGLVRYVGAVANNGTVYYLSLIHEIRSSSGGADYYFIPKVRNQITLDQSLWNSIHSGMRKVVEGKVYFNVEGLNAAGKTGTAQEATNRPNHALFVGYAPYSDPKVAIAVRIANGYASDFAAQVACSCLQYYFVPEGADELITGTASEATAVSGGD
ncbi:MAG: penicillin-binding protein [Lachnospiraceae bacterium]|nr:penicillin-binding protein [Lachnospiraceae bacterium]